jgi:hypothetical protein
MLIVVTEKAENDSEGNWTDNTKEPSDTAGDDGGDNARKTSQERLPFERFLSG